VIDDVEHGAGVSAGIRVFTVVGALLSLSTIACGGGRTPALDRLDGSNVPIPELHASIQEILDEARVAGLSLSVVDDARVAHHGGFGVRRADTGEPVGPETVMAAASFSKTVFAYLVMLLVEDGLLDLDRPLESYLPVPLSEHPAYSDLSGDPRASEITARHVLSHSTGFPNWRWIQDDNVLRFLFDPGTRFFYSGEGIVLLQRVVEEVTGRGLEELAAKRVFGPFGMTRSSYVWQDRFEDDHSVPHDEFGRIRAFQRRAEPGAAGSMFTTSNDYGRFLAGLLVAQGARKSAVDTMWSPQVRIRSERMFGPGAWEETDANDAMSLSWALGWGRFESEHGPGVFHTGHDFGWQNYTVTFPERGVALVMMSNSDNFESVAERIAELVIADTYSPYEWLGYVPFDPTRPLPGPPAEPVAVDVHRDVLARYAGTYLLRGEREITVALSDEGLTIARGDGGPTLLHPESNTAFFIQGATERFSFLVSEDGQVTEMRVHIEELELSAPRIR
jgi:CubicO group peptidase (beta-lactamase class C family)